MGFDRFRQDITMLSNCSIVRHSDGHKVPKSMKKQGDLRNPA
jgi:hypothetical protein